MNLLCTAWLLAQAPRADQFVKGFRDNHLNRGSIDNWLAFGVVALAVVVVFYILQRFLQPAAKERVCSAPKLFRELCRLHHLDRWSIGLLQRIAKRNAIEPADLFLRPDLFLAADAAESQLCEKLFGVQ
jgi:hypothetical protein